MHLVPSSLVLVLAYAHRLVAVVVDNLLDDHVGHGVVLARHTLDLPELVVLGLLDLAPLRVVDGQMVEPAGLLLRVGVPLLDCEVLALGPLGELSGLRACAASPCTNASAAMIIKRRFMGRSCSLRLLAMAVRGLGLRTVCGLQI